MPSCPPGKPPPWGFMPPALLPAVVILSDTVKLVSSVPPVQSPPVYKPSVSVPEQLPPRVTV